MIRIFFFNILTALLLFQHSSLADDLIDLTWTTKEGKAADGTVYQYFVTTTKVPVGSKVRIKVIHIDNRSTHSNETTILDTSWAATVIKTPDDGEVIETIVKYDGPLHLRIGQRPSYNKPDEQPISSKKEEGGISTLTWKASSLKVKVIAAPF